MTTQIKKFLPSKKFLIVMGAAAGIVLAILIATSFFSTSHRFQKKEEVAGTNDIAPISEAISRDSNGNDIPDWEETLWHLDPKGDGAVNKKTIAEKKAAAGMSDAPPPSAELTETQKFSQQLLTTVAALRTSGTLTPETLATLGTSLEINIDERRSDPARYTERDMKVVKTTAETYIKYRAQIKQLVAEYQTTTMGKEFDILGYGLEEGAPEDMLSLLEPIAETYMNFGKTLISLETPTDAVPTTLVLANVSTHVGVALLKIEKIYTDAMTGIIGIDEYVNDIDVFNQASRDLISYFVGNDAVYLSN